MKGQVIWITGLSGSGKTTIAKRLISQLSVSAILLDGDDLREVLKAEKTGFDYDSRKQLAFTYARFAKLLAKQNFTVIVSTISLFHELHTWNRQNLPNYLEIFLDVPESTRRSRDPKGLYIAEAKGELNQMAGGETPVEFPKNPDLIINNNNDNNIEESINKIIKLIK